MPMKRALTAVAVATMLVGASSGCSSNNPSPVSAAAAKALSPFVSALREAASHKSVTTVQQREADLVQEVNSLVSSGDLSTKRGNQIENAASVLFDDFKAKAAAASSSPTPTDTSPTPTDTESDTPGPSPTITVTVTPTVTAPETGSPEPTDTSSTKGKHGNGVGNDGTPPGQAKK